MLLITPAHNEMLTEMALTGTLLVNAIEANR
jgi:hypothetical protein